MDPRRRRHLRSLGSEVERNALLCYTNVEEKVFHTLGVKALEVCVYVCVTKRGTLASPSSIRAKYWLPSECAVRNSDRCLQGDCPALHCWLIVGSWLLSSLSSHDLTNLTEPLDVWTTLSNITLNKIHNNIHIIIIISYNHNHINHYSNNNFVQFCMFLFLGNKSRNTNNSDSCCKKCNYISCHGSSVSCVATQKHAKATELNCFL